jgi:ribonuclease P protein component
MPARPPRLKQRRDFQRVAGKGQRAARPGLVLQALPVAGTELRIGFTATKKIGNAVVRNRTKRRLREAARLLLGSGQAQGFDLVLIGREATAKRPWQTLLGDLRGVLKQAGVLESGEPGRAAEPPEAANAARAQTASNPEIASDMRASQGGGAAVRRLRAC